jgi:hypothetical protein
MDQSFVALALVILLLVGVFVAIGMHQVAQRAVNVLDGHLERLQGKLDVMLASQIEHNEKIDIILHKLF